MTTRREFVLGVVGVGSVGAVTQGIFKPRHAKEKDPFVGTHEYYMDPGDSFSIDTEATDQWTSAKKVTIIIEDAVPGDREKGLPHRYRKVIPLKD